MEVLNAAGLTPLSLPNNKPTSRRAVDHRRLFLAKLSRPLTGGLAALSSVFLSNGLSRALTYEEALSQSFTSSSSDSAGFDIGLFLDGVLKFGSENPLLIGGGAAALAIPVVLSRVLLSEPKPWGVVSAKAAYAKLAEEGDAALLDIRGGRESKEVGSPDLRGLKKKVVAIAYRGEDKTGFLKKLSLRFKDPGSTTLFILDKFDGNSELVAELVTANGFKAAYAIKDGAEGARGWLKSELPWTEPKKGVTFDFGDLQDVIDSTFGENSDGLPVTLGLAVATGLGLFAFTEMETVLQLLGSAAIVQFVTKKLLLAEVSIYFLLKKVLSLVLFDLTFVMFCGQATVLLYFLLILQDRKVTLKQAEEFLNTKIAPKELVDEIKMIGKALLPASSSTKSLPSSAEATPEPSTPAAPPPKADVSETKAAIKEEAPAEPAPAVNSVPKAEVSEGALAGFSSNSRPLSPYPYYPDFKPPSSPCPSKP
ncbi:rhodanese-like domain-containing protein 4, chloroplastic [Iris pallida]|uniref:Protein THYLAKOID RHODANESE-LIKE, chloroplastic n=1 Tax=Iris pallida TaxID=29817 RepID=A0AAX6DKQ6_IRIPA|nr:rhodanese-like domain-containing protein 4, chloroplastic [Iris pallida]